MGPPAGSDSKPLPGVCICGAGMLEVCMQPCDKVDDQAWYSATLVRYSPETQEVTLEFAKDTWGRRDFSWNQVRLTPPCPDNFTPAQGDVVEVFQAASSDTPPCWIRGSVKEQSQHQDKCIVFVSLSDNTTVIAETSGLRPWKAPEPVSQQGGLFVEEVKLNDVLVDWLSSQDAWGCLNSVRRQCQLLQIRSQGQSVLMVGTQKSTQAGQCLLNAHMYHQVVIQHFHERRRKKQSRLDELRDKSAPEEFFVEKNLIGWTMGANRARATGIEKKHSVRIFTRESSRKDDGPVAVTISGQNRDNILKAREELELTRFEYPVGTDQIGGVIGKNGQNIAEIREKCNVLTTYHDDGEYLEIVGCPSGVEDARLLLDTQLPYISKIRDLRRENQGLDKTLEKQNYSNGNSKKGKGVSRDDRGDRGGDSGGDYNNWQRDGKGQGKRSYASRRNNSNYAGRY